MSVKSRKSAGAIDRPFDSDVRTRAQRVADRYQVIVSHDDGHWYGRGLELPHVFGDGTTANKCVVDTREALVAAVAVMLEQGEKPPTPARVGRRNVQVNIRLTAEEKAMLESAAMRQGYSGLSDFMRAASIESAR